MIKAKTIALVLVIVMLSGSIGTVFAADNTTVYNAAKDTADYLQTIAPNPTVGSIGGEWSVIALARSGYSIPDEYFEKYCKNAELYIKDNDGVLHTKKYTEYSRVILALTALGKNPKDVAGYNLLLPLGDFRKTTLQGLNGPVWALIALDSNNYDIPDNPNAEIKATKDMYIKYILDNQLNDGGWGLSNKSTSDVDITGMALQALAKYKSRKDVGAAIEKALDFVSKAQNKNGGFVGYEAENLESTVQVLVALCTLGISVEDERFVKNGVSVLDNLMEYYEKGRGFNHTKDGNGVNLMSTEQGFYALVAYLRSINSNTSLYDMSDVKGAIADKNADESKCLANKHKDVNKRSVINLDIVFSDIVSHKNKNEILELAQRGIINGKNENTFDPDGYMTRAEFATIVVKALGLPQIQGNSFFDVNENDWYCKFVNTAYSYGIVNGTGERLFTPNGKISKEEAAVMTERAAKLCGMETELSENYTRDILAQFTDYLKSGPWARNSLAFCFAKGILDDSDTEILPKTNIKRCEIADMLYKMLAKANLL